MAYCRKCGKLLSDNANHCTVCGAPVSGPSVKLDTGRIPRPQEIAQAQEEIRVGRRAASQEEIRLGHPAQSSQQPRNYDNSIPLGKKPRNYEDSIPLGKRPQNYEDSIPLGQRAPQPLQPLNQMYQPVQPAQPVQPPKKKKSGVLIAMFILLGVLILALLGVGGWFLFGGAEKDDPTLGRYEVVSCVVDGEEVETNGEYVVLRKGGAATLSLEEPVTATWKLDGEELTIETEEETYIGTLENETITLEIGEKEYTFRKDQPEEETEDTEIIQTPTETTAPRAQDRTWWAGDWYGWWTVLEGSGEMYLMERSAWDVCARIEVNEDGTCGLHIWDEHKGDEQFVWLVDGHFEDGTDDRGVLVSDSGTFRNMQLGAELNADPAAMPYGTYEDLICITGTYVDPENAENSCTYCIILRPWGTLWDDLRDGDTTGMPYPDMLPIRYDSWYLPLIQEGAAMPETFN